MPERPVDTEPQGPSRRRILTIVGLTIFVVAIPPVIARTLYTAQGVSRNVYVTELMLPVLSLLAAAGGIWGFRQALGRQALDVVWFRWNRGELVRTVLLIVVIPVVYILTNRFVQHLGLATLDNRLFYAEGLPVGFFVAVTIYRAFAGPFTEELFWRGSVQTALTPAVGAMVAWVVQAVVFAGMHMRPVGGFVAVLVLGLMTGLWRWRRRTLLPIILAHVALNSLWCAERWPSWLEMGQVKIVHDYNADLVELARPRPYDPNDDARYDYERAENSFQSIPDELDAVVKESPTNWTPEQRDAIRQWIAANSQALEYLARGASKPYYCPDYRTESRHFPIMRSYAATRSLAFALNARIKLHAWDGREEDMVRDTATLYRFGTHLTGRKVLLDQLAGAAIRAMTLATVRNTLASHLFSILTLDTLSEEFQAFSDTDDDVMEFSPERLFCFNEIQKIFTDDGHGHGHVPEAVLKASPGMTSQQKEAYRELERYETTQSVEAFFEHIRIAARKSPWELHDEPNGAALTLQDLMRQNGFLDVIGPAYVRVMDIAWREKTELDAALTVLAILRYEADRGRLPESLEELVSAGYLERVPRDSYSSGPLVYQQTEEGFRLYSWGLDFDDDGGTPSKWGQGEQGGDQVFWPVEDYR